MRMNFHGILLFRDEFLTQFISGLGISSGLYDTGSKKSDMFAFILFRIDIIPKTGVDASLAQNVTKGKRRPINVNPRGTLSASVEKVCLFTKYSTIDMLSYLYLISSLFYKFKVIVGKKLSQTTNSMKVSSPSKINLKSINCLMIIWGTISSQKH